MSSSTNYVRIGSLAAAAALIVYTASRLRSGGAGPESAGAKGLSPIRAKAIALIDEVIPSKYGSANFARIAPSFSPEILTKYPTYSTCGELPAFVGRNIGFRGKIAAAGLELLRTEASAKGCWRTLKDGRPKPGDFFGLASEPTGILVHVGVIVSADGSSWTTADAGQGPLPAPTAEKVTRAFSPEAGTLTTAGRTKVLAGWVDIDCYAAAVAGAKA